MTMVYLASSTVSGGSSTYFTIPSGYDILEFHFKGVYSNRITCCASGIDRLNFQLSFSSGAAVHSSTVIRAWNFNSDTTTAQVSYDSNAIDDSDKDSNAPDVSYTIGSATSVGPTVSGVVTVYDPLNTSFRKHFTSQSQGHHYYSSSSAHTNSVFRDVYYHTTSPATYATFAIGAPWVNQMYGDFYMYGIK